VRRFTNAAAVSITETLWCTVNFLQVCIPAAVIDFTNKTPIYYIDPKPIKFPNLRNPLHVLSGRF
jgi:NAD-dependent deacetylase